MMSDDVPDEEKPRGAIDDPRVTQARHRCIVLILLFLTACAIAAIVLPLVLDCDCDNDKSLNIVTPAPTQSPVVGSSPTSPTAPSTPRTPAPTGSPTISPAPTNSPTSQRLGHFIDTFLVPLSGTEVFEDSDSPQYRAAVFLADHDNIVNEYDTESAIQERYALTTFYYAMDGDDSWFTCYQADTNCTTGSSWLDPDVDHCDWSAVGCNDEGRVVDLIFSAAEGNGLVGTLPHEIGHLEVLENLVAVNNLVGGSFPESLGAMTSLVRVVMSTNVMSGVIPEGFLEDSPLELLMVSNNRFSGSIPSSLGKISTMTQLHLDINQFSGTIPSALAELELLGTLNLADNDRLRGSLPDELYGMFNLENLYLDGCSNIQGALSSQIVGMSALVSLRLGGSGLTGTLPAEMFLLGSVEELDLTDGNFEGPLSDVISFWSPNIRTLKLSGNEFTGTIPSGFESLTLLNVLQLEDNDLTGEISSGLCDLRGDGRTELNELSVDCLEVSCDCCTNCDA
eukprot:Nitzschia sp. Nitz4//scaffold113_size70149//29635//31313//NITZ4_005948-RA/size70149-augustus-gene-0.93-mRNA-1//-1//CDS//3329533335//5529//frame0